MEASTTVNRRRLCRREGHKDDDSHEAHEERKVLFFLALRALCDLKNIALCSRWLIVVFAFLVANPRPPVQLRQRAAGLLQKVRLDERIEIAVEHAVDVADLHPSSGGP